MRSVEHCSVVITTLAATIAVFAGAGLGWAAPPDKSTVVNCSKGTITNALTGTGPVTLIVQGTCTENVVITRDDVTLTTDGTTVVTVAAADPGLPAILVDGARRVVINGKVTNGFAVSGGTFGIVVNRGGSADVMNCLVTGATNTGLIASNSGTLSVESCAVTGNATGVTAANTGSAYVANSTISGNSANGLVSTRSAYLRVGQDRSGTPLLKPVTVSGNGATGVVVTENSSASIVGGSVENNGSSNIFVGRGSGAEIGLGVNELTGGVLIQGAVANGISVEGGNATIVYSSITSNQVRGIVVSNGGSARIGITNATNVFGANTISANGNDGIGIFHSGAAFIGGNTIDSNGAIGINVGGASADVVGGNTITNNAQTGIFAGRGAQVLVGDPGFGAPAVPSTTVNAISGNGTAGPNTGGIFAFAGANIQVTNGTISNNIGAAVQAFEAGIIELRGTTTVTVPATGSTPGATAQFGATLRVRDTASIVSATGDGMQASNLTAVNIRDGNTIHGNGAGAFGVRCFNTFPLAASAATLTGNLGNVTGTSGSSVGCSAF